MKYRVTRSTTSMTTYDVDAESEAEAIAGVTGPGTLVGTADLWSAVATGEQAPPGKALPTGFGGYLRRIAGGEAEAAVVAEHCRRAGFAWVALMVEASDGYIVPLEVTKTYARVLDDAGFDIYVWTFPGEKRAASAAESMSAANLALNYANATDAWGVIADIEAAYKSKPEALGALLGTLKSGLGVPRVLGAACYPVPSMHPTLPWAELKVVDFGSPMFYETAQNQALVEKGLTEWSAIVPAIVPILDGWSGSGITGAARFKSDIIAVLGAPPTPRMGMTAASIWSESQMDDAKRAVSREMADAYDWPGS